MIWVVSASTSRKFDFSFHPLAEAAADYFWKMVTTGNWGSVYTVDTQRQTLRKFTAYLDEAFPPPARIQSWSDERISKLLLRNFVEAGSGPSEASMIRGLVAAMQGWKSHHHPMFLGAPNTSDGIATLVPIDGTSSATKRSEAYEEAQVNTILAEAETILAEWRGSHFSVLDGLGFATDGDHWLHITFEEMVERSREIKERLGTRNLKHEPDAWRSRQFARAIRDLDETGLRVEVHPYGAEVNALRRTSHVRHVAAAALLAYHADLNVSSIAGIRPQDVTSTSPTLVEVSVRKDRRSQSGSSWVQAFNRKATRVVRELIALTEIPRATAARQATTDPARSAADTLLVGGGGRAFTGKSKVRLDAATSQSLADVSLARLRVSRLGVAYLETGRTSLDSHSAETGLQYLTRLWSDDLKVASVLNAQSVLVNAAKATSPFGVSEASMVVQAVHASRSESMGDGVSVSVGKCATGGRMPDTGRLCQMGMIGCLLCPHARVLPEHVPFLEAARQYAAHLGEADPKEYSERGYLLEVLAKATLDLYPGETPDPTGVAAARPIVAAHYETHRTVGLGA